MDIFYKNVIPSIFEIVVTQPFDVWKLKSQAKQPFHLKNSFKGIIPRAIGFLPMRTTFWFLYDYTNKYKLSLPLSSFIITTGQTAIDYPVEIYKQRNILTNQTKPKYPIMFLHHYTRNLIFTTSLLSIHLLQKQHNTFSSPVASLIGATIGSIVSQPFDVWKTRTFLSKLHGPISFNGLLQRIIISSIGLSTGSFIHSYYSPDQKGKMDADYQARQ